MIIAKDLRYIFFNNAKPFYKSQQKTPLKLAIFFILGWLEGFEPSNRQNHNLELYQLSYSHHFIPLGGDVRAWRESPSIRWAPRECWGEPFKHVSLARLERATYSLEGSCSIRLSYRDIHTGA